MSKLSKTKKHVNSPLPSCKTTLKTDKNYSKLVTRKGFLKYLS